MRGRSWPISDAPLTDVERRDGEETSGCYASEPDRPRKRQSAPPWGSDASNESVISVSRSTTSARSSTDPGPTGARRARRQAARVPRNHGGYPPPLVASRPSTSTASVPPSVTVTSTSRQTAVRLHRLPPSLRPPPVAAEWWLAQNWPPLFKWDAASVKRQDPLRSGR